MTYHFERRPTERLIEKKYFSFFKIQMLAYLFTI